MGNPIDPVLMERLGPVFESQKFMHHLGVRITGLKKGWCEMSLNYDEKWSGQNGVFHGGVIGTVAESVTGISAATCQERDRRCTIAEYKLNLLAPARGERIVGEAKVIKSGRTLLVAETNIYVINDQERTHCAMALVTLVSN